MTNYHQNTTIETRKLIRTNESLRITLPSSWCKTLHLSHKTIMVLKLLDDKKIQMEKLTQ